LFDRNDLRLETREPRISIQHFAEQQLKLCTADRIYDAVRSRGSGWLVNLRKSQAGAREHYGQSRYSGFSDSFDNVFHS
jgi:hypothetical protein